MKPSVGRIVHWLAPDTDAPEMAAIITFVHNDQHVSLTIFHPSGMVAKESNAPFSETLKAGHWTWPSRV